MAWPQGILRRRRLDLEPVENSDPVPTFTCRGRTNARRVVMSAAGSTLLWLAAAASLAAEPVPLPEPDDAQHGFSVVLGAASEYAAHGLARSLGQPVVTGEVGYGFGSGWQAAARGSTMNLNRGPGPSRELALYVGRQAVLNEDWQAGASLARYSYWKNVSGFSYDYTEATIEAEWRSAIKLRLQYSPDYSLVIRGRREREFQTFTGEVQFSRALHRSVLATAAVGYYDLSDAVGTGYFFWTLGAVATRGRASLAVSYVQVDDHARRMFSPRYTRNKLIATLAWRIL